MARAADTPTGLTDRDLRAFYSFADSMRGAGVWGRVERHSEPGSDVLNIHYPGSDRPAVSIGRRAGGRYVVCDHKSGHLRFGRSMTEALEHVRAPLVRRARPEA